MATNADSYWTQFQRSLSASDRPPAYIASFSFGFSPDDAREIAQLVLSGRKTATGSLLWSYEYDGKPPPNVGDHWVVTDGGDDPVCILQTIEVRVIPFDEVTPDYARDGGEGDLSQRFWREIYWQYIVSECKRIQRVPTEKAPLVMERFRVVYREPRRIVVPPR